MKKISIGIQPSFKRTEVIFSQGLLFDPALAGQLQRLSARFVLFCDENIASILGEKWCAHLKKSGLDVSLFTFPPGEQEKSRERKATFEDLLLSQRFGKDTCLIALGGGVTTDLIGFLASTYCRGVPLIFAPTTLLGMVDAAIGGKTGINTPFGKNLLGTFYPAECVLIDPETLSSLPASEWTGGLAEVIKYALIRSPELFQRLRHWDPKDPAYLERILYECISIKAQVVEMDFEEKAGLRRILNFGHTIAHALELLEEYHLPHGDAVAIGMLVESAISAKLGYLPEASFVDIEGLIRSFPFPLRLTERVTLEKMKQALVLDKKSARGTARFVLLDHIGECHPFNGEYCSGVPEETLDEALRWMLTQCSGGPS